MLNIQKSKLRSKLLSYYFNHPNCELYIRETARVIKEDPANLSKEFAKLERLGIFISTIQGKQKYYKLNKNYPLYNEFKNIVAKTVGMEKNLKDLIDGISGIELCFIYGSYASGEEKIDSDIDLFIAGKIQIDLLLEKINKLENKIGREINYRVFSKEDFKKAIQDKNSFILNILKRKKIFLIGDEKDIKKFS